MKTHTTNYFNTLIEIAPDCPVAEGSVPPKPGTVAAMQYEKLMAAPYTRTSDELIFEVFAERSGIDKGEWAAARAAFFSKGQPCLRSSPLVKTYGWGVHHDAEGRVALYGAETAQYHDMIENEAIAKTPGMRSARAGK
jgi:Family of unknown function (DUF6157)